jgi:hypothetical protein
MLSNPYFWGVAVLVAMYCISVLVTRSSQPWALARGNNKKLSTSELQFFVFTVLTVFAYVTVFAARYMYEGQPLTSLPDVPSNLLILMGLSVITTTSSKGISISYIRKNEISIHDSSDLFADREGVTDLKKVQMLVWTLIAAAIYLLRVISFIKNNEFASQQCALPDIDGALLVLTGLSQGGYVAGKIVSRKTK